MSDSQMRFLIIRFSSMGDIALTNPVLDILYENYGRDCVDYITKSIFTPLIKNHPAVNHVMSPGKTVTLRKLRKMIRHENYYKILDLHKNLRSFFLTLGIKNVKRYKKEVIKRELLSRLKISRPPFFHVCQKYLQTLFPSPLIPQSNLYIPDESVIRAENLDYYQTLQKSRCSLILAPGASKVTKMLPFETWEMVLKNVRDLFEYTMIVGNGMTESHWADKISSEADYGKVINLTKRLTIAELMLFISLGNLFAGNDSGPAHLAAMLKKYTVVIFGQTSPDYGFKPLNNTVVIEPPVHLICRPCGHLGYKSCPLGHHDCMRSIDAETIINEIRYGIQQIPNIEKIS